MYPDVTSTVGICLLFCLFLHGQWYNTLEFWVKPLSMRSDLEGLNSIVLFPIFLEGDPNLSEELDGAFNMTWSGASVLSFLEVSNIADGCLFF